MNAFSSALTQERLRIEAVDRWFVVFDDCDLRRDCPSAYHEELLRQADELDRLGLVQWPEWRDLRLLADRSFLEAVAGADYQRFQRTVL